jgi:MraZ protein
MATDANTRPRFLGFMGTRTATLDPKGRVTFPAFLRDQALEGERERFVLICAPERCLALYPESSWLDVTERVTKKSREDADWKPEYEAFLYANAEPVLVDGMGRILLPEEHRRWAGLAGPCPVVFAGARSRVQVWCEERWQEHRKRGSEGFGVVGKDLLR